MDASWWRWARPLSGAVILGVLLARLGGGAFVEAARATDARALAAGAAIAAVTTTCGAWRWRIVARRLGVELSLPSAVAACYRAQFLNVTLPGGVLGDIDRGVRHGRQLGDVGRGLRAVAWERTSGQVVLGVIAVLALIVARPFTSPALAVTAWVLVATGVLVLGAARVAQKGWPSVAGRSARVAATDARALLDPAASVGIVVASLAVVAGHVATFVLAAGAVGVRTPVVELLPLALLVLLVSALPLNLAGWGPREGAAAWAFAAAGLGAAQGLAVAVAYGTIVFVATLPGAVLLLVGRSRWSPARMPSGARRRDRADARAARHTHLDAPAACFPTGDCEKPVYCATPATLRKRERLAAVDTVVDAGAAPTMSWVSEHLAEQGGRRLMVQWAKRVHARYLTTKTMPGAHSLVLGPGDGIESTDAGRSILVPDDLRLEAESSSGATS